MEDLYTGRNAGHFQGTYLLSRTLNAVYVRRLCLKVVKIAQGGVRFVHAQ